MNKPWRERSRRVRRSRENKLDAAREWFRGLTPAEQNHVMLRMLDLQGKGQFGRVDAELITAYEESKHTPN